MTRHIDDILIENINEALGEDHTFWFYIGHTLLPTPDGQGMAPTDFIVFLVPTTFPLGAPPTNVIVPILDITALLDMDNVKTMISEMQHHARQRASAILAEANPETPEMPDVADLILPD